MVRCPPCSVEIWSVFGHVQYSSLPYLWWGSYRFGSPPWLEFISSCLLPCGTFTFSMFGPGLGQILSFNIQVSCQQFVAPFWALHLLLRVPFCHQGPLQSTTRQVCGPSYQSWSVWHTMQEMSCCPRNLGACSKRLYPQHRPFVYGFYFCILHCRYICGCMYSLLVCSSGDTCISWCSIILFCFFAALYYFFGIMYI